MPERHGAEKRTILPRFHNLTPRGATIFRRRSQLMTPFAPGRRPRALKAGHKTSTSPGGAERASEYFHLPVPAGMSWPNRQNHLPPNADIARRFKPIPRLTLLSPKDTFAVGQISGVASPILSHHRAAFAQSSRTVGAGSDGRRPCMPVDGEIVWSRPPDAEVKFCGRSAKARYTGGEHV